MIFIFEIYLRKQISNFVHSSIFSIHVFLYYEKHHISFSFNFSCALHTLLDHKQKIIQIYNYTDVIPVHKILVKSNSCFHKKIIFA